MKKEYAISDIIRQIRHDKNLSQDDVAERMGLDRSYISAIETGSKRPSVISLLRIAHALGVKPGEVWDAIAARMEEGQSVK